MPYQSRNDLPEQVKDNLPPHAQEIYQKAFNSAWDEYKAPEDRRGDKSREDTAHAVAWSAVENVYEKDDGKWVKKD